MKAGLLLRFGMRSKNSVPPLEIVNTVFAEHVCHGSLT